MSPEERLRAALANLPDVLYANDSASDDVHCMGCNWNCNGDNETWTISAEPDLEGWETDSAYPGYGLPESIAKALVEVVNASRQMLAVSDSTA